VTRTVCLLGLLALLASAACAHARRSSGVEGARKAAELFHHRARWKDFGGAALLLVPEKREPFEAARRLLNDDRDLSIADYQLDELTLSGDGLSARVASKVSWHRLPSLSQHDETVTTELVWLDGAWLIARQQRGPFHEELSEPYPEP
jgi:hypothetical protein